MLKMKGKIYIKKKMEIQRMRREEKWKRYTQTMKKKREWWNEMIERKIQKGEIRKLLQNFKVPGMLENTMKSSSSKR